MALTKVIGDGLGGTNDLTVDTTTLTVDATNNRVGVGTSSPDYVFEIETAENAIANFKSTDANANIRFTDSNSTANGYAGIGAIGDDLTLIAGNDNRMKIDSAGHITMPNQSAFLARPSGSITNVALNTGQVVAFDTEVFDQNADFASNVFTAPVTGRYLLNYSLYVVSLDSAANFYESYLQTSNRIYYCTIDPDYGQDNTYFTFNLTVLADMDANDTADVKFYQSAGTQQTDIGSSSHFAGHLAC